MKKFLSAFVAIQMIVSVCLGQNESVKKTLEQQYYYVYYNSECNQFIVTDNNQKEGVCDANGKVVFRPKYDDVYIDRSVNCSMYQVELNGKVGYCDAKGNEIISPNKYTDIHFQNNYNVFYVKVGDLRGLCDDQGRELIPPRYSDVIYREDHIVVEDGDKVGWYSKEGKLIIAPKKYTYIWYDKDSDIYMVNNGDKVGYCDNKWNEIIAPERYTYIWHDKANSMYKVENGDKVGYCDSKGNEIITPSKYTSVLYLENLGLFQVKIGEKMGYCNGNGKEVVPPEYDNIVASKDGNTAYFIVKTSDKSGLVDSIGKTIVKPMYDSLFISTEGLCRAKLQAKWGYVSIKDGTVVVPFEYDKVSDFKDGVAKVTKNGQSILLPNPLKAVAQDVNRPKVKGRAVSVYPAPDSDVDKDIPLGKIADNNTHAFIIANENYPVAKVPYALNDGWMFEQYCKKTLGIKEGNVHLYEDATGGNIMACVEQMKQVAKAANGQATIIFYYAGHAFPDEEKSTAYLLPIDGDSKNPSTGYSLEKLYKEMNSVQVKQMVCFLDACFSGATRDDKMLVTGRGVTIKVKDEIPQGNMVVMTSSTGAETAHSFEEMHHGLFTYYLLQKLQETKGDVTLGELSEYVIKMVKRKSVLVNQKKQTPTVIPSPKLQASWPEMKL